MASSMIHKWNTYDRVRLDFGNDNDMLKFMEFLSRYKLTFVEGKDYQFVPKSLFKNRHMRILSLSMLRSLETLMLNGYFSKNTMILGVPLSKTGYTGDHTNDHKE